MSQEQVESERGGWGRPIQVPEEIEVLQAVRVEKDGRYVSEFRPLDLSQVPDHALPELYRGIRWVQKNLDEGNPLAASLNGYNYVEDNPLSGYVSYKVVAKRSE